MSICVYCEIDEATLQPKNASSQRRLESLHLTNLLRAGDSVLDIGCNSGLLALTAASAYGCKVTAVDIQQPMITKLKDILVRHPHLPIQPILGDLFTLDSLRQYDHVFFLQVLHWACFQGHSIEAIIDTLHKLTRKTLTIEFPWDIDEPAIKHQTNLTRDNYNAKRTFRALCAVFPRIEVMGFQDYFSDPNSNRILMRCSRFSN